MIARREVSKFFKWV